MDSSDLERQFGSDVLVHTYVELGGDKVTEGRWQRCSYMWGGKVVSYYELFPFCGDVWTGDTLTFRYMEQVENFSRALQLKLVEK